MEQLNIRTEAAGRIYIYPVPHCAWGAGGGITMNRNEIIKRMIASIVLILAFSQVASATDFYIENTVADGVRPYQFNVTLSNATGTNNATNIYLNGNAGVNYSSAYFQDTTTHTTYAHCVPDNTTGRAWVNITLNGTVRMYYGNTSRASSSNCTATFEQFNGTQTTSFITSNNINFSINKAVEASVRATAASHNLRWGISNSLSVNDDYAFIQSVTASNNVFFEVANENTPTQKSTTPSLTNGVQYNLKITNTTSGMSGYVNDAIVGSITTTNLPNELMGLFFLVTSGTGAQNYSFVRAYTLPEPAFVNWSAETQIDYLSIFVSNNTRYSNTSQLSLSSNTPAEAKRITLTENYNGSFRVKWEFFNLGAGDHTRIYKNGVAWGADHAISVPMAQWESVSEDFNVNNTVSGDIISVYAWGTIGVGASSVRNMTISFDYDYVNITPTLLTPTNNSVTSFSFPPQFTDVTFTWNAIGESGYQIQISKDAAFSLIEYDITTTAATTTKALTSGAHYWRVRTYNSGVEGANWSSVFTFSLTESTPSISGTSINGVVYEYIGGVQTPISGASVYLTNSTYTTTSLTGTNGYFLFTGLDNASTYSLYSIKQGYDNSQVFAVSPANAATTTVNIPMRIYISPYVPNFVFEKFIVRSFFDDPYPGVTANIYVNGNLNPSFTGTTDSMGQVVFQLIKDTYYRIELSGGGLPVTITEYFYGKEEAYYITIATGFPDTGDKFEDINASLFVTQINGTYANLSLYYSDNSSTTSTINFFARYYANNTNVCADQNSVTYPVTLNCTVFMGNITYVFGWNSTSSKYGFSQGTDVVDFKANNATKQIPGLQEKIGSDMLNWISIIGLIFVAGMFSARSVRYGVVIVPFAAVILYWAGTLQVSALLVHSALILGILTYLRMSENKLTKNISY